MKTLTILTVLISFNSMAFFKEAGQWFRLEPQPKLYESTYAFEVSRESYITEYSDNSYTWGNNFKINGVASYSINDNNYLLGNEVFDVYKDNVRISSFQTNKLGHFNYTQKLDAGKYTAKLNSKDFACTHDFIVTNGGVAMSNNLNLNCYSYSGKVFDKGLKSNIKRSGRGIASIKE